MSRSSYEIQELVTSTRALDVHRAVRVGARGFRREVWALALPLALGGDGDAGRVFARASLQMAELEHPYLVQIHDLWEGGGRLWAIVPILDGAPLADQLDVPASRARPLALERATSLVVAVSEAVHALSDGCGGAALGGVSADSVWVLPDGSPKLLPTVLSGPPVANEPLDPHRAPEEARGEPLGPSADVHALALLFWDLLALGRAHLPGDMNEATSATPARIDQALVHLVMRSLSASPSDRPENALAFRAELSRLVSEAPAGGDDTPTVEIGATELLPPAPPEIVAAPQIVPVPLEPPLVVMPAPVRAASEPARPADASRALAAPRRLKAIPILAIGSRARQLRVVEGEGSAPSLFLRGPSRRWVVGRGRSADLVVCDPDVSREHFEVVESTDGRLRLYDLGSKNGVFVNGALADQHALSPGDEVRAGGTRLRFES